MHVQRVEVVEYPGDGEDEEDEDSGTERELERSAPSGGFGHRGGGGLGGDALYRPSVMRVEKMREWPSVSLDSTSVLV